MRMLLISFLVCCVSTLVVAGDETGGTETGGGRYPGKFSSLGDDPVFQALAELKDGPLQDKIADAIEAFYTSRFVEAHEHVAAVMANHPESSIGGVLYNFLLLVDGAALGFSGECGQAIESLNKLQGRLENDSADDPRAEDDLAGVIFLKADILGAGGEPEAALAEMDRLIDRFGPGEDSGAHWRAMAAMQRKALLLDDLGRHEESDRAFQAYLEALQRENGENDAGGTSGSE